MKHKKFEDLIWVWTPP